MLIPEHVLLALVLDMYVVRPSIAKRGTSKYTHVVLEKEVIQSKNVAERIHMKCIAQFMDGEDAENFATYKRKHFLAKLMSQRLEIHYVFKEGDAS